MADLFSSGRIVDLILLLIGIEVLALALLRRATGRGPSLSGLWPTLASGACLLVALRFALTGQYWGWIALALLASLAAHVADLYGRFRR